MAKKGGYSANDMRSISMNNNSSHHRATAENHRVQTSGHSRNDMRSIVKNSNNVAYSNDKANTANQKSNK